MAVEQQLAALTGVKVRADRERVSEDILSAARRGDAQAWEHVYRLYARGLFGYLMVQLTSRDDAAEVLSETWLRALEHIKGFKGGPKQLRSWLYTIAGNAATDRLRSRRRISLQAETMDAIDLLLPGHEDRLVANEDQVAVRRALLELDPDDRRLLWLRVCEGLTSEEVGVILNRRPGSVRMQQLRLLRSIAAALEM